MIDWLIDWSFKSTSNILRTSIESVHRILLRKVKQDLTTTETRVTVINSLDLFLFDVIWWVKDVKNFTIGSSSTRVIFGVRFESRKVDKKANQKPIWKLKHTNSILESFEYLCQRSSKLILIILSYTVSKLVRFLRHSVTDAQTLYWWDIMSK